ncbi:hypothetical protein NFI88_00560 [Acetobacteraceae bacterium KSS12]|uniref:Uncharacterized protein n=1 Tax=Rhizosaccharibacter radicis TaxID=2782605 RepID=A0ABT1VT31_9PROT|nr:hypothetical protein [Acetobacteraceae bacterium KSS12]
MPFGLIALNSFCCSASTDRFSVSYGWPISSSSTWMPIAQVWGAQYSFMAR